MRPTGVSYRRFEALLRRAGLTVYRVAKDTGIAQSTFSEWKSGRSEPKADKILRLAEYFGVSVDAFYTYGEPSPSVALRRTVPVIGEIRAGSPIVTEETLLGEETVDGETHGDTEDLFYLRVTGNSMRDAGMVEGSLVLFRKQQYAENGDIVACLVEGDSATVKRFFRDKKKIELRPENPDYHPILLTTDDFESGDARILGVALEVKTKL